MQKLNSIILYTLWIISLIGILVTTFTNFQYPDLNLIVGILFAFAVINTLFTIRAQT